MKRIIPWCAMISAPIIFTGCLATSPLTEANIGREQPLVDLVMSSQVTGNTMLPYYETTKSVFCGLLPLTSVAAEKAITKTLQEGVDVNQRCRPDAGDYGLPLDVIVRWIGYSSEPGANYDLVKIKQFISRAEILLQRGAKTAHFAIKQDAQKSDGMTMSMNDVLKEASTFTDAVVAQKKYSEQIRREAEQKKFFNLEAIAAALQIVGMAANNYAASRGGLAVAPALIRPVNVDTAAVTAAKATSQPIPATKSQSLPATAGLQSGKATSNGTEGKDIYEPNPDFGGRIWFYGGGEGRRKPVSNRADACQQAERDREEQIAINARDRRDSGVERRSACACSYSARNDAWFCRVWYLPKNSGAMQSSTR